MKQPRHLVVAAIAEKTLSSADFAVVAKEVAAYLLQERRVNELEPILRDVIVYRAARGHVEAELLSAHEVGATVAQDVRSLLKGIYPQAKDIKIIDKVRPELMGGVRVVMPHEQLDLTVRSTMSAFKNRVMTGKEL